MIAIRSACGRPEDRSCAQRPGLHPSPDAPSDAPQCHCPLRLSCRHRAIVYGSLCRLLDCVRPRRSARSSSARARRSGGCQFPFPIEADDVAADRRIPLKQRGVALVDRLPGLSHVLETIGIDIRRLVLTQQARQSHASRRGRALARCLRSGARTQGRLHIGSVDATVVERDIDGFARRSRSGRWRHGVPPPARLAIASAFFWAVCHRRGAGVQVRPASTYPVGERCSVTVTPPRGHSSLESHQSPVHHGASSRYSTLRVNCATSPVSGVLRRVEGLAHAPSGESPMPQIRRPCHVLSRRQHPRCKIQLARPPKICVPILTPRHPMDHHR